MILSPNGAFSFGKSDTGDEELYAFVDQYAADAEQHSSAYYRVVTYHSAGSHLEDNYAVRKVLDYEHLAIGEVHDLVKTAMEQGRALADVLGDTHPEIVARMGETAALVDDRANDPEGLAYHLVELLGITDATTLADELRAEPIGASAAAKEDDEAIETAASVDPVTLMTMVGSKGLSAHHVIVLGCDEVHMEKLSPLAFFVAVTRARTSLHLVASRGVNGAKRHHQYVADLPEEVCSYFTYRKSGHKLIEHEGRGGLAGALRRWDNAIEWSKRRVKKKA